MEMSSKIPSWIQRFLLPELEAIKGELRAINARIDALEKEVKSFRNEVNTRFEAINIRIEEFDKRVTSKIGDLEKRLDMAERLAVIEAKLKEHEEALKKLTA